MWTAINAASRRRETVTLAAAILLGGIVWLAVGRAAAWPGWLMIAAGIALIVAARRRA